MNDELKENQETQTNAAAEAEPIDAPIVDNVQEDKIAELTADLQRTRADFENFRRQSDIQRAQFGESVKFATVKKVLPLIDDFERAIAAQPKELKPLEKNLEKTLKNL